MGQRLLRAMLILKTENKLTKSQLVNLHKTYVFNSFEIKNLMSWSNPGSSFDGTFIRICKNTTYCKPFIGQPHYLKEKYPNLKVIDLHALL